MEERLNEMKNDEEDHEAKLDELREEIKKTNDLVHENTAAMETKIENTAAMETAKIENRLKNIEAMLAQIQAGGIFHSSN